MIDTRLSSPAIAASRPELALLTVASIEQHGAHLPVGTDWIIGCALSAAIAVEAEAYLLPPLPFGSAREHTGNMGTAFLAPTTLFAAVKDLCLSLHEQGFRRVAVMQTHGGNWVIKPAVRELNLGTPGLQVVWFDPFRLAATRVREICETSAVEVHGGEMETSVMLALDPQSVRMDLAVDFIPDATQEYLDYVPMTMLCPPGIWGRARLATAEKGRRCFDALVQESVAYIRRSFARLEEIRGATGS